MKYLQNTSTYHHSVQIIDTLGWGHVKRPCGIYRNQVTTHHLTPLTLIINLKGKIISYNNITEVERKKMAVIPIVCVFLSNR